LVQCLSTDAAAVSSSAWTMAAVSEESAALGAGMGPSEEVDPTGAIDELIR